MSGFTPIRIFAIQIDRGLTRPPGGGYELRCRRISAVSDFCYFRSEERGPVLGAFFMFLTKFNAKVALFIVIFFLLIGGLGFYYSSNRVGDVELSILKDIIFFILSVFLSYSFALIISRNEYKRELEKLGNISVRRVGRLSENIRHIARSLQKESSAYADELFRVAKDADESTADILLITEITDNRSRMETVFCPYCGYKDTILAPEAPGGTDKVTCHQCYRSFNLHRVQNGLKIVPFQTYQNSKHALATNAVPMNASELKASQPVLKDKLKIKCPNPDCSDYIYIDNLGGTKPIYCFNCHYQISYDFNAKTIVSSAPANFLTAGLRMSDIDLRQGCECPNEECRTQVRKERFFIYNKHGQRFAKCLGCQSIIIAEDDREPKNNTQLTS
jgi:hypothetical protein